MLRDPWIFRASWVWDEYAPLLSLDGRFVGDGDEVLDTVTGEPLGPGPEQPYIGTAFLNVATNRLLWGRANFFSDNVQVWNYEFQWPVRPSLVMTHQSDYVGIGFLSQSGYAYRLQTATTSVAGAWNELGSPVLGNGGDMVISDISTNGFRFYRLLATPP